MAASQDAGAVLEGLFEQWDGLVESARVVVGDGEVVACGEGVGVVGAQEVLEVFEVLLEQGDGVVEPASVVVVEDEVVACGEGVGVVGA